MDKPTLTRPPAVKEPREVRIEVENTATLSRKQRAFLKALEKSLGVVGAAQKLINVSRNLHTQWLREYPDYREQVEQINDSALDFVEARLYSLIKQGDVPSTIFYMKTKGRGRGYAEKLELGGRIGVVPLPMLSNIRGKGGLLPEDEVERLEPLEHREINTEANEPSRKDTTTVEDGRVVDQDEIDDENSEAI